MISPDSEDTVYFDKLTNIADSWKVTYLCLKDGTSKVKLTANLGGRYFQAVDSTEEAAASILYRTYISWQ